MNGSSMVLRTPQLLTALALITAAFLLLMKSSSDQGLDNTQHERETTQEARWDVPAARPDVLAVRPAGKVRAEVGEDPGVYLGAGHVPDFFSGLSLAEAEHLLHGTIASTPFRCTNIERYGKPGDGGYDMCAQGGLKAKQNDCLVYSFGIKGDWSFDEGINEGLGCVVHSFDPSINKQDHVHRENMYFHNLGIWGRNFKNELGWELRDLKTIMEMLNHTDRVLDHVKFDVEGAEWPLIEHLLSSGMHSRVKQMAFEVHTPRLQSEPTNMTLNDYGELFNGFHELSRVGFEVYLYRTRNWCCERFKVMTRASVAGTRKDLCCYELFFVNKNFL